MFYFCKFKGLFMAKIKEKTEDNTIQSVYINPLTDFGFKKIFLNKELLINFLNDVVGMSFKEVTYLPTEGLGEYKEERATNFDLLCTNEKDEYFIVEMQLGEQSFFKDRVLFYASHVIRKQAPRKKRWDFNLKAVYVVSILNFITFKEDSAKNEVIERVFLYREKSKTLFSEKLKIIFIELPKFNKQPTELKNNTDTWLFLLKNTLELKTCPPEINGKIFKLFLEIAAVKHLTSKEMETYKKSLEHNYYVRNIADCARLEGKIEGRMEERRQVAAKLLIKGASIEEVMYLTELSKEQILEVLEEIPKS